MTRFGSATRGFGRLTKTTRLRELEECLDANFTYCDVNGLLEGRAALSRYMGAFQAQVRSGRFRIESVIAHHGRMLAEWTLLGRDNAVLQTGRSFAVVNSDGRFMHITGFFDAKPRAAVA